MSQCHCGRNLIHVLSTRSGRSRESFFQVAFAKANLSYSSFDRSFHRQSEEASNRRDILARHPNQFIEKLVHAPNVTFVEQISALIKKCSDLAKINVLENRD